MFMMFSQTVMYANLTQLAYARSQIEWAKKNKETWEEAKSEINKIDQS